MLHDFRDVGFEGFLGSGPIVKHGLAQQLKATTDYAEIVVGPALGAHSSSGMCGK